MNNETISTKDYEARELEQMIHDAGYPEWEDEHPLAQCVDENGDFSFEKFAALVNSGKITISKQNMFEPGEDE